MMALNEIRYNPATVFLVLKSIHTQSMLFRIESTRRYTHHKQVKVVLLDRKGKLTIAKSKPSRLSYSVVVSHQ
jgi:hypothetical protein